MVVWWSVRLRWLPFPYFDSGVGPSGSIPKTTKQKRKQQQKQPDDGTIKKEKEQDNKQTQPQQEKYSCCCSLFQSAGIWYRCKRPLSINARVIRSDLDIYRHNKRRYQDRGVLHPIFFFSFLFLQSFGNKNVFSYFFFIFISHMAFSWVYMDWYTRAYGVINHLFMRTGYTYIKAEKKKKKHKFIYTPPSKKYRGFRVFLYVRG